MNDILNEIKTRLINKEYQNEEHVRFSLVGRIIDRLNWNIWNPKEVYTEYVPVPNEDKTKVDIALFLHDYSPPSVFIEVKAVSKIDVKSVEQQLRDYNRNNTAAFSIITNGQIWRFYFSQTGGEFSDKCFKVIDFFKDDIDLIEQVFQQFLLKENIENQTAEQEAKKYLQLSKKQRALDDIYVKAQKIINEPPFPSLPKALVECLKSAGFDCTEEEAIDFLRKKASRNEVIETTIKLVEPIKRTLIRNDYHKTSESIELKMKILNRHVNAVGIYKDKKIKVLKDSTANIVESNSIPASAKRVRDNLIKDGILLKHATENVLVFTEDYTFDSVAIAAGVLAGYSINARECWRDRKNNTINDLELST